MNVPFGRSLLSFIDSVLSVRAGPGRVNSLRLIVSTMFPEKSLIKAVVNVMLLFVADRLVTLSDRMLALDLSNETANPTL